MQWRERFAPIIAEAIRTNGDAKAVRKAIRAAYPLPLRKGWAYRVYLAEVRRQLAKTNVPWRKPSAPREQLKLFRL